MPSSSNGDQIKESDRMSTQLPTIPKTSIRNGSAKYGTTNEIRRACETRNRLLMPPKPQNPCFKQNKFLIQDGQRYR